MGKTLEWAEQLEKAKRNKPSKEVRLQLFALIETAIQDEEPPFDDCINALMKFGPSMTELFYENVYFDLPAELQEKWDRALFSWAREARAEKIMGKRITSIIRVKLAKTKGDLTLSKELDWLLKHDKDHALAKTLGEQGKKADLRRLLDFDLAAGQASEEQMLALFDAIFSASPDEELHKACDEFRATHRTPIETDVAETSEIIEPCTAESVEAPESAMVEGAAKTASRDEQNERACSNPLATRDDASLTAVLLEWMKQQEGRALAQEEQLRAIQAQLQRQQEQSETLSAQMRLFERALSEQGALRDSLKMQLTSANERVRELEAQLTVAKVQIQEAEAHSQETEKDMAQLQMMFENSVKQQLDGFKHDLAADLRITMKDFACNYSDLPAEERAEVYKAFFEELVDRLRHNGIEIEEN